jgi:hypothetical protein
MIERLTAKPGVVAFRVSGHFAREDIDKCYEILDEAMASHPKVDLFIEVDGLTGFDTEALTSDLTRGWTLLGKLDRFGRVAIVSDERWVRWLSRIESALLPGISYRIYKAHERQMALDWVQGREDLPYGHAIKLIESTRVDTLGIEINGRLSAEEISQVAQELNQKRGERPLRAIVVHIRSLTGVDPLIGADPEYLRMKLGLLHELDRYAVVGAPEWLAGWAKLIQPMLRLELRCFDSDEEAKAWNWLDADPLPADPVAA